MSYTSTETLKNRLATQGADQLSTEELLTILFGKDSTTNLLATFDKNIKEIFTASIEELTEVKGIGFTRACQIQVIFELVKRILSSKEDHPQIKTTDDVFMLLAPHMMYLKQEEFRVILLDSKNKVIHTRLVSLGSLDSAFVKPKDVFRPAIVHGAASIILVHNHPSGDPEPSESDILLTRKLCMCSKVVDVEILDHVIIGFLDYTSMNYRNLLKFPEVPNKELNKNRKVFIALELICSIGSNMLQCITAVLGGFKMGEKKKILKLFGATGTMEVLEYLAQHNTAHYRQMEEHVNSFMLNRRLRELLSFNLVDHHVDKTEARKEWYSLTEKGKKVLECIWDVIDIMNDKSM